MTFLQSTLEEITESEAQMVRSAVDRFGNYFLNAWESSVLLSKCVVSVNHSRLHFARYHAVLKKHHTLAVLSLVRLHEVAPDLDLQSGILPGACRQLGRIAPLGHMGVVGRGSDRQDLTDRLDPMRPTMIVDEGDHGLDRRSSSAIAK